MQVLLLLFLMLPCLPEKWSPAAWKPSPSSSGILTWGGIGLAVLFAALIAYRVRRQLHHTPERREYLLRRYARFRLVHTLSLFAVYLAALYLFGWGWAVQSCCGLGDRLIPGAELIILSPFFAGLTASWACFYDAERAIHMSGSAHGEREWTRWAYVMFHLRQHVAMVFLPLLLFIIEKGMRSFFSWADTAAGALVGVAGTLALFAFFPLILRYVLGLKPLPEGPIRERLLAAARRLNVRCSDIMLCKTRGGMANAMVVGVVPWLRYVIFTDRLLSDMSPDEVDAVFGHEVGHVKHRHIIYYLCFLMVSMATVWVLASALLSQVLDSLPAAKSYLESTVGEEWAVLPLVVLLGVYIFVVFGFLSRRCERQADIYGCRAVSCTDPHCQGHREDQLPASHAKGLCPTGITTFIGALEKVAVLNGISRDRPGWLQSWQHSTIALRVAFLENMRGDLTLEPRFQRRVAMIKLGLLLGLFGLLTVAGALAGWEMLLAMG